MEPPAAVGIVIPCLNPPAELSEVISEVLDAFDDRVDVVVVDDGSTDTAALEGAQVRFASRQVRFIRRPVNEGKGAALQAGFAQLNCATVGFIDADGDLSARDLPKMVAALDGDVRVGAVAGAKERRSQVAPLRRALSIAMRAAARAAGSPVGDTQTGVKVFRADALRAALRPGLDPRFGFDLELIVGIARAGWVVTPHPVVVQRTSASTVRGRDVIKVAKIVLRLATKRFSRLP